MISFPLLSFQTSLLFNQTNHFYSAHYKTNTRKIFLGIDIYPAM
ncbi:MAG: hypothetical protein AB1521_10315 [Bacteroidota bacterium]